MKIYYLLCYLTSLSTHTLITNVTTFGEDPLPLDNTEPFVLDFGNDLTKVSYFQLDSFPSLLKIVFKNNNCGNIKKISVTSAVDKDEEYWNVIKKNCKNGRIFNLELPETYKFVNISIKKNICSSADSAIIEKIQFFSSMELKPLNIEREKENDNRFHIASNKIAAIKVTFNPIDIDLNKNLADSSLYYREYNKDVIKSNMNCYKQTCMTVFSGEEGGPLIDMIEVRGLFQIENVVLYTKVPEKVGQYKTDSKGDFLSFDKPIYIYEIKKNNPYIIKETIPVNDIVRYYKNNILRKYGSSVKIVYKDVCVSISNRLLKLSKKYYFAGETVEFECVDKDIEKYPYVVCNANSEFSNRNGEKIDFSQICSSD